MANDMSENIKDVSMLDVANANENGKKRSQNTIVQSFSKLDIGDHRSTPPLMRRRSTLIFDDDDDPPKHEENVGSEVDLSDDRVQHSAGVADPSLDPDVSADPESSASSLGSITGQPQQQGSAEIGTSRSNASTPQTAAQNVIPVDITWQQGGNKVYVTGSFTGWRKMIGLVPDTTQHGVFHIKLQLPPGTHRFRFIVDNELRFSDFLPTATDQMGNFVNYLEIVSPEVTPKQEVTSQEPAPHQHKRASKAEEPLSARSKLALQIGEDPDDMGDGYSRFHGAVEHQAAYSYTRDIPAVFTDPSVMEQYYLTLDQQQNNQQNMAWLTPPQLPPQLENVILNNYSAAAQAGETGSENNSGALPIPNHVVLNHLATSSIKHNTLCVASIVRYKRKYATQMLYAPLQ
ncbi:LAMI_0F11826g1_1 [Lachancea mirantina]|uniref:LAMI_0F11826g1_1 n=1 Tax=Lachancea mirantina TaxID=1230905 RepID=A0A1G4K2L5_9SACH|nr:LAMI_0F11826g1_1 [Lachancea mirantina]